MSKQLSQNIAFALLWLCGLIAVAALLVIIGYTVYQGIPNLNWEFFSTDPELGQSGGGGIKPFLISTAWTIGLVIVFLIPAGILAGIYMSEYAPPNKLTSFIRYCIDTLAGMPSIVVGVFGFIVLVVMLGFQMSILSGALTLAILLMPYMIRITEEAIRMVPQNTRAASLALGASKWQTVSRVVLPAALAGILTSVILCIARAFGETAPLLLTMGGYSGAPTSPMDGGRVLAMHIYISTVEYARYDIAFATATVLLVIILVFSIITNVFSTYSRKKLGISRY